MKIAIDVFGGDHAPDEILKGCLQALEKWQDLELLLFGDQAKMENWLKGKDYPVKRTALCHAPEVISMEESPTLAIKRKKDSSMVKALEAVHSGAADCVVSAGSTGALLTGALLIVRRLPGVKRPGLGTQIPTRTGSVLLLDSGANVDCRPSYLLQFAAMADAYMRTVAGLQSPRIGLLNIGAEEEKGNELTKKAYQLLKQAPVNFSGNCEARELLSGGFDAVVCDGFDGNIVLKYTEGLSATLLEMLKAELVADARSKLGGALAKPAFRRFKKIMDYTEHGGAPLLGVNGGVIKAHGSSNAKAFCSAIGQARTLVQNGATAAIAAAVAALPEIED